ncbi:MAG: hypothetical protein Q4C06_08595, partial [Bacillota bacterium]|nr:hypothetical protein [Bacillota bacterium]
MDRNRLKTAVESIELSASARERIADNCIKKLETNPSVSPEKRSFSLKRSLLIAALLLFCLPVIGMAVTQKGVFRDVKNLFGAVVGTEYEAAPNEVALTLAAEENMLTLTVSLPKDTPPFCYCETLQLPAYSILDEGGHTILRSSTA